MSKVFVQDEATRTLDFTGITCIGLPASSIFPTDETPTSPSSYDDEFDGAIPGLWTARNSPNAITYPIDSFGYLSVSYGSAFGTFRGYSQPLPSTGTFEMKFNNDKDYRNGNLWGGIGVCNTSGDGTWLCYGSDGNGTATIRIINSSSWAFNGNPLSDVNIGELPYVFLKLAYNSGTNQINTWLSPNGWNWKRYSNGQTVATASPTLILIGAFHTINPGNLGIYIDYFRKTA